MAVNPDDIDLIASRLTGLYRDAELALLDMMRGYLAQGMDAPTWAESRLAAVGGLRRSAESILGGLAADAGDDIRATVASAYRTGRGSALRDLPEGWYPHSGIAGQARAAARVVTRSDAMESLAGALIRDLGDRSRNVLRHVEDVYRQTIAGAVARSLAANITRRQASQQAWQAMVDRGVGAFVDRAGRTWRLSTYAEMAVRTVTARAAVQGQTDRLATLGLDLVTVSDHGQECKLCRPYEGKVLARGNGPTGTVQVPHQITGEPVTVDVQATLDDARSRGLLHPNCRHSIRAYLPGVTRLPRQPTADPAGDEARQRQRAIERQIRKWKDRAQTALDPQAATDANRRVRAWQGELRAHLAANPRLKRLRYREQPGAGSQPTSRVPAAGQHAGAPRQLTVDGTAERLPARTRRDDTDVPEADSQPTPGQIELDFDAPRDPLDGIDLQAIPEDELFDLFSQVSAADHVDERVLQRLADEMDRRDALEKAPPADDAWLTGGDHRFEDDWPDPADMTPEQQRLDELLAEGMDFREAYAEAYGISESALARQEAASLIERRAGETLDQAVRRAYDEYVNLAYLQAEDATRGFMLSPEGVAASLPPRSAWSGNPRDLWEGRVDRARQYASEELLRWWADNGRLNFTQFKADMLRRQSDIDQAKRSKLQSNGEDFI